MKRNCSIHSQEFSSQSLGSRYSADPRHRREDRFCSRQNRFDRLRAEEQPVQKSEIEIVIPIETVIRPYYRLEFLGICELAASLVELRSTANSRSTCRIMNCLLQTP